MARTDPAHGATEPLRRLPPRGAVVEKTCATVFYEVTEAGVVIDITIDPTSDGEPGIITFEADDAGGNPATGDTTTSSIGRTFFNAARYATLTILGVSSLDHVLVLPIGYPYDGCYAYPR